MDWTAITGVADTAAAMGVIGSLIFVGFQVRQNSKGLQHAAVQSLIATFNELYSNLIDSGDMAEIFWQGLRDPDQIEGANGVRFYAFGAKFLRAMQGIHWQWQRGVMDDKLFNSLVSFMEDAGTAPGWQHLWRTSRHRYDSEFQGFMDSLMAAGKGRAMYPEWATEED